MNKDKEDFAKEVIADIQRIAKEKNTDTMTQRLFKNNSNISMSKINNRFSFSELVKRAGLKIDTSRRKKTDYELWEELLRVCNKLNKIPRRLQFNRNSTFADTIYVKRYSNWNNVLLNFKKWLKENKPSSKFINLIPDQEKIKTPKITKTKTIVSKDFVWPSKSDTFYGPPMNFRGLIYEPINEQGVIFLFAKISEEIGFNIEALRSGYPDCEGTRLIDKSKNKWGPVLIEFEYNSKSFLDHGHDPEKCDVIVCWTNDWPECPLEVIELKEIVKILSEKDHRK